MKASESGFTLIELMIVVAIVGTLAALAIPAYQDYTIRAQVADGLSVAAGARTAVEEYRSEHGVWPADNAQAALAGQNTIVGTYTGRLTVTNNIIEIQFAGDSHQDLQGKLVLLTASYNDGSISWTCTGVGIDNSRLPRSCRPGAAKGSKKGG
jgi:type IV pilus assembly protein PilA